MKTDNRDKKKKVTKSIRNQIIASALCPLFAMSMSVSVLTINGYDDMLVANVIAFVLLIGTVQLLYVAHSIVKPLRQSRRIHNAVGTWQSGYIN